MLDPEKLRVYEFTKALRGYAPQEVDKFIQNLIGEIEKNNEKISSLSTRLKAVEEENESLRKQERIISETLVTSKTISEEIVEKAKKEEASLLREAESRAEEIVGKATAEAEKILRESQNQVKLLENDKKRLRQELSMTLSRVKNDLSALSAGVEKWELRQLQEDVEDVRERELNNI